MPTRRTPLPLVAFALLLACGAVLRPAAQTSAATTVALMRELMDEGRATFLVGNHEHKLARYATEGRHAAEGRVATHRELADFGEGLLQWYVDEQVEEVDSMTTLLGQG